MGRWADLDSDEHRLPEGFTRVGYDADSQTYTYQDSSGRTWEGEEGNRYGQLHPVGSRREPSAEEISAHNARLKEGNKESVRMMLPFALLVLVFMLLLFKFINGGAGADDKVQVHCAESYTAYEIRKGDTCWGVAKAYGLGVDDLLELKGNEGVDCDKLGVGQQVCVPEV
ncbi:carbohydrate-binding module family 50 protein [Zopfia rhizophila CBS 207.26]|uniref:Carbohydrate-binding module family 50 protein n=1 Tax=Zopfia rhizophila CBS 207.26 TaxID=1314779 RepID=A0A6A6DYC8_9PEZI|nr:carbohydrate-binding module family 50 protein [Zopfia rhizophila CBS 207.26]